MLRNDATDNKPKTGRRIGGLSLVQNRTRLFILGKPGAGKTTFLKYVALQSANGNFDRVPIFVGLKEWADSGLELMSFIAKQFSICNFPDASPFVDHILENGKAIVMFDGLDEVRQEDDKRTLTIAAIRDFTNKYYTCKCLITCRIAARTIHLNTSNTLKLQTSRMSRYFRMLESGLSMTTKNTTHSPK